MNELFEALRTGDAPLARRLVEGQPALARSHDAQGVSAVLWALYHDQPALAAEIARAKGPLDVLEAAALGDDDRLAELLRAQPGLVRERGAQGRRPLHVAALFDRVEAARLLLEAGADREAADVDGQRPVDLAGERVRAALGWAGS